MNMFVRVNRACFNGVLHLGKTTPMTLCKRQTRSVIVSVILVIDLRCGEPN